LKEFKKLHWENELYGHSVMEPVYNCWDTGSDKCRKPNNMTNELEYMEVDKKYHGYFTFENLEVEKDD